METVKVVINVQYGGFSISEKTAILFQYRKGLKVDEHFSCYDLERWDPDLIAVIEFLGEQENSDLLIEYVPKGKKFIIDEYDGHESILFADEMYWTILQMVRVNV